MRWLIATFTLIGFFQNPPVASSLTITFDDATGDYAEQLDSYCGVDWFNTSVSAVGKSYPGTVSGDYVAFGLGGDAFGFSSDGNLFKINSFYIASGFFNSDGSYTVEGLRNGEVVFSANGDFSESLVVKHDNETDVYYDSVHFFETPGKGGKSCRPSFLTLDDVNLDWAPVLSFQKASAYIANPEPTTFVLFCLGLIGLFGIQRYRAI